MIGRLISNAIGNTVLKAKLAVIFTPVYVLYRAHKSISDKIDDVREHNALVAEQNRRSNEAAREARDPLYRAQKEAERARIHAEALERQRQWDVAQEGRRKKAQELMRANNRLAAFFVVPSVLIFIYLIASHGNLSNNSDVSQVETRSSDTHDMYYIPKPRPPRFRSYPTYPNPPRFTPDQESTTPTTVPVIPSSPEQEHPVSSDTATPAEDESKNNPSDHTDASYPVGVTIKEEQVPVSAQDGANSPVSAMPSSAPKDSMLGYAGPNSGLSDKPLDVNDLRDSYITDEFLTNKSLRALSISYNGIYAMHGCTFKRPSLHQYFSRYSWYKPNPHFSDRELSTIERHNVRTIRAYERNHFGY